SLAEPHRTPQGNAIGPVRGHAHRREPQAGHVHPKEARYTPPFKSHQNNKKIPASPRNGSSTGPRGSQIHQPKRWLSHRTLSNGSRPNSRAGLTNADSQGAAVIWHWHTRH